jgi:hypothetical protein
VQITETGDDKSQGGQAVKTVPDNCPFCESPIMVHGGNALRSSNGGFATYECRTSQDVEWDNDQFNRVGQSDVCRFREIQLLTKQRDEARERIKRLEEAVDVIKASLQRSLNPNEQGECKWLAELPMTDAEFAIFTTAFKAKEAKP